MDLTTEEVMAIEPREKLRRARSVMGWSQDRCDQIAGVKAGRTYSYERGRANPPREFMAPLAEAWGIDLEWFYDGQDDMPPIGRDHRTPVLDGALTTTGAVAIRGELPTRADRQPTVTGQIVPKVGFILPPDAEYRRISDDALAPMLRKGDLVLVIPDDLPRRDTLALVRLESGLIDVYYVTMDRTTEEVRKLVDLQADPGAGWKQIGYLVEVRRTLAGGLVVSFECESGLSPEMLNLPELAVL